VAVYSTFLQRSFDQIFQEVSLQRLPVILCMDRAGLVGGDGAVHHGFLDITYLRTLPNLVVLAPADEQELKAALRFAVRCPQACAVRYPRADLPKPMGEAPPFETGRGRLMRKGGDATILAYGACVAVALDAAELLAAEDLSVRVFNARFAKPIDADMLAASLLADHPVITVEDHSVVGGFGSAVLEAAQDLRLPTDHLIRLGIPADRFISQGSRKSQLAECGIDAAGIAETVHRELAKRRTPAERASNREAGHIPDNVASS
jgi:1-deoxy-D-xylulose-5-phosphate synthase